MKRIFSFIAVLIVLSCFLSISVQATDLTVQIEYLPDGSYFITETQVYNTRALTKVGDRSVTYYSANDEPQWKMTVTGEFIYDGTTCTCTYATGTYTIYNTSFWYCNSANASNSDNMANYTAVIGRKGLGVQASPTTYSLPLYCDKDGNLYW